MDAVLMASRKIAAGDVESMIHVPFLSPKADIAFSHHAEIHDTTIGSRFVNLAINEAYDADPMPQTKQHVADAYSVPPHSAGCGRTGQQNKAAEAQTNRKLAQEITPVAVPRREGNPVIVVWDEHPRATTMEAMGKLKQLFPNGLVTAGNALGVNDRRVALIPASEAGIRAHGLRPIRRYLGGATEEVVPRVLVLGPGPLQPVADCSAWPSQPGFRGHRTERGLCGRGQNQLESAWYCRRRSTHEP